MILGRGMAKGVGSTVDQQAQHALLLGRKRFGQQRGARGIAGLCIARQVLGSEGVYERLEICYQRRLADGGQTGAQYSRQCCAFAGSAHERRLEQLPRLGQLLACAASAPAAPEFPAQSGCVQHAAPYPTSAPAVRMPGRSGLAQAADAPPAAPLHIGRPSPNHGVRSRRCSGSTNLPGHHISLLK
jgi:hypothetical protein